jgi:hypothetical protein
LSAAGSGTHNAKIEHDPDEAEALHGVRAIPLPAENFQVVVAAFPAGSGGGCPEEGGWPCYGRLSHLCADLFQLLQDVQLLIPEGAALQEEPYAHLEPSPPEWSGTADERGFLGRALAAARIDPASSVRAEQDSY